MKEVKKPKDFNTGDFARKGQRVYLRKYKKDIESQYRGKIAAVEPESEDIFIGDSVIEAAAKAKKVYPDRFFHFVRIGYKTVHLMK